MPGREMILGLLRRLTFLILTLSSFVCLGDVFFRVGLKKTFGCANSVQILQHCLLVSREFRIYCFYPRVQSSLYIINGMDRVSILDRFLYDPSRLRRGDSPATEAIDWQLSSGNQTDRFELRFQLL